MPLIYTQHVVDVKYIIAILVIETIVLNSLARFRQTPPWIPRRLIRKLIITQSISRRKMHCQRLQWLKKKSVPHTKKGGTLINPPSGFARRYFGCSFTMGCKSAVLCTIRNFAGGGFV